jgi:hypothetical protein
MATQAEAAPSQQPSTIRPHDEQTAFALISSSGAAQRGQRSMRPG